MANLTFTGSVSSDWNVAGNWTPSGPPGAADGAVVSGSPAVISGGSSDIVAGLDVQANRALAVGGSTLFGGSGTGSLDVDGIAYIDPGAVLVGSDGSTFQAINIDNAVGGAIGGGGTFIVAAAPGGIPYVPSAGNIENGGVIRADGADFGLGALTLTANTISYPGGSFEIWGGSTLELNAFTYQPLDVVPSQHQVPGPAVLEVDQTGFGGTIAIANGLSLDLFLAAGQVATGATISGATLDIATGGTTEPIALAGSGYTASLLQDGSGGGTRAEIALSPVCYRRGTRLATPGGLRAIEDLVPGDRVLTVDGTVREIVWIGRRRVDCRRHPKPERVWPVRIRKSAFGRGAPSRDLYLSPQHAIFAEGVLIPVKVLVNGDSIAQVPMDHVEYLHVELERHSVLLAEGLPAESYLDTGDRGTFDNAAGAATALFPDFARWVWDARACAELKVVGSEVAAVRKRLARKPPGQAAAPARTFRMRAG
ncbi:MAG: Hint domain-containing protein [Acetobacteraceae bacterium]